MLERRGNYQFDPEEGWRLVDFSARLRARVECRCASSFPIGRKTVVLDSSRRAGAIRLLAAAYPLKRTLDRPFGRVIIRYGETGNEENFIDSETDERST